MTDAQRLHILNSSHILNKIRQSGRLRNLLAATGQDYREAIRRIYLNILSRNPTEMEIAAIETYSQAHPMPPRQVAGDLVWALINTKEFLYRH